MAYPTETCYFNKSSDDEYLNDIDHFSNYMIENSLLMSLLEDSQLVEDNTGSDHEMLRSLIQSFEAEIDVNIDHEDSCLETSSSEGDHLEEYRFSDVEQQVLVDGCSTSISEDHQDIGDYWIDDIEMAYSYPSDDMTTGYFIGEFIDNIVGDYSQVCCDHGMTIEEDGYSALWQ
ncbi:hypothetical protein BUALT_Bualt03G0172800 [Buddleja alternifolia]|uniref:Uncharacterized protein n=1 Tax=Buddleja alternifolia TaxID=168488 RepID=A0AAV6Y156_9LAMI|nr:hypothetical protein BUALT_Bualt03G0172800 [Buddleja alternifolia]